MEPAPINVIVLPIVIETVVCPLTLKVETNPLKLATVMFVTVPKRPELLAPTNPAVNALSVKFVRVNPCIVPAPVTVSVPPRVDAPDTLLVPVTI